MLSARAVIAQGEREMIELAKKTFGRELEFDTYYDSDIQKIAVFRVINVSDSGEAGAASPDACHKHGLQAAHGDELLFQVLYAEADTAKALDEEQKYGTLTGLRNMAQIRAEAEQINARVAAALTN